MPLPTEVSRRFNQENWRRRSSEETRKNMVYRTSSPGAGRRTLSRGSQNRKKKRVDRLLGVSRFTIGSRGYDQQNPQLMLGTLEPVPQAKAGSHMHGLPRISGRDHKGSTAQEPRTVGKGTTSGLAGVTGEGRGQSAFMTEDVYFTHICIPEKDKVPRGHFWPE